MRSIHLRKVFALLVCGALVACGGGGDDPSGAGDLLAGTLHFHGYTSFTEPPVQAQATWGTLTADGAGTLGTSTHYNENGSVGGPRSDPSIPYAIGGDRSIVVRDPLDTLKALATGRISPGGSIAALGSLENGYDPGMWLTVRRAGSFDASSLNGDYHLCGFSYLVTGGTAQAEFGTIHFNGAGVVTGSVDSNAEGGLLPRSRSGTYAVQPDGTVTWTLDAVLAYEGGILQGGELVVLAGSTLDVPNSFPNFVVLIRARTGATAAQMSGSYFMTGMQVHLPGLEVRSISGSFVADGVGTHTMSPTINEEGSVGPGPVFDGTFTSHGDGGYTVTTGWGSVWGAMSADGSFGALAGGTAVDTSPMIFFLLR